MLRVVNLSKGTGIQIQVWQTAEPMFLTNVMFSLFSVGDENGTVSLVDTKSARCALSSVVHSQCVTGLVFSPHRYCPLSWRACWV